MYPIVRVSFGVFVSVVLLILLSNSCGFFISPSDDPAWVEVKEDDGGGVVAGSSLVGPGVKVYQRVCQSCHQANGQGLAGVYPSLAGSEWVQGDPGIPVRLVLHGFSGEIVRNGNTYNGVMTPWGEVLDDQEIADVVTTIRASFGNTADAVSSDMVAEVRAATANRLGPYSEADVLAEMSASASAEE